MRNCNLSAVFIMDYKFRRMLMSSLTAVDVAMLAAVFPSFTVTEYKRRSSHTSAVINP
jgi:hypothetical protein